MKTWTQGILELQEAEGNESKLRFRGDGFKTIVGCAMVLTKITKKVGVYHVFYF